LERNDQAQQRAQSTRSTAQRACGKLTRSTGTEPSCGRKDAGISPEPYARDSMRIATMIAR
jgi:hypothetical protein